MASASQRSGPHTSTPLPWDKLGIVFLMRLAEPISFSIVFPFISEKIWTEFGVAKTKGEVGFYAGMIESTFAITQTLTVLQWGRLSDRVGRKKVMLIGLTGAALSQIIFGFSKSLPLAIIARGLCGMLNGNAAVVKSLITELTDPSNRASAFSFNSLGWGLGTTIGSLLGGYLSKPAESFPRLFSRDSILGFRGFWESNPFALPCFVSVILTSISIILGALFLEETLPSIAEKKERKKQALESTYGATSELSTSASSRPELLESITTENSESTGNSSLIHRSRSNSSGKGEDSPIIHRSRSTSSDHPVLTTSQEDTGILFLLLIPQIQKVLLSGAFLALNAIFYDSLIVLFLYSPIRLGGLSMSTKQSGFLLSVSGIIATIFQLSLFPPLQRRFGSVKLYAFSMCAFPVASLLLPASNLIAKTNLKAKIDKILMWSVLGEVKEGGKSGFNEELSNKVQAMIFIFLIVSSAFKVIGYMAFPCNTLVTNDCTKLLPQRSSSLGTLNGLSQMAASSMRAIGPSLSSSLFAYSISRQVLGGQLVWIVMILLGIVGSIITFRIEELETVEERESRESR